MMVCGRSFAGMQEQHILVPGAEGRLIRVLRVCISTSRAGTFELWSDPGGATAVELMPPVHVAANATLDLRLGARYGLTVGRGRALGFSSVLEDAAARHSVLLWYELVN